MALSALTSRAIKGEFYNRLAIDPGIEWVNDVSMFFMSDQAVEIYEQLGMVPPMQPWIGARNAKHLSLLGNITVPNIEYESTLEVLKTEIRRDKTAQVQIRINDQVRRAQTHWAKLLTDLLETGTSAVCQDGQFFFDTDHSEGNNTTSQDNDLTTAIVAAAAPTAVEMETAVISTIAQIIGFKDNENEPMNEGANEFTIMVPVNMMGAAATALKSPIIQTTNGARSNIIQSIGGLTLKLVVNPRLSSTSIFYTFRTDGDGTKAFIRQEEMPLLIESQAEGSAVAFKENKHEYGISASRGVGLGMWQHAAIQTFTTA